MEDWEIVESYFCRVCDLPQQELSESSRALVEVYHSFGLIQNGGLHGYLCDIGDEILVTVRFYETAGIVSCARILRLAHDLWRQYWSDPRPDDSEPDDFRNRFGSELDALEDGFYSSEDELMARLAELVSKHSNQDESGPQG